MDKKQVIEILMDDIKNNWIDSKELVLPLLEQFFKTKTREELVEFYQLEFF